MKRLEIVLVLFLLILSKGYSQDKSSKPELRLSYITSVAGRIDQNFEMIRYNASRTSLIRGYDLKIILPTKRENLQWLLGTFFQDGQDHGGNSRSDALAGAIYLGPQISTNFKYINFSAYISAGLFSISDQLTVNQGNEILYNSVSNYTAPGTKSGLDLSFHFKRISLTGGYQIFMTSGKNSVIAYQGIEVGLGVKF